MVNHLPPVWELSARVRERQAQPIVIDGQRYIPTADAADIVHYTPDWLRKLAMPYIGNGPHITPQGYVFVRRPRGKTDGRAPIYWREDSLR